MIKEISFNRIKIPRFKIGRFVLNEYEIRQIMAEVSEGKRKGNIKFKDDRERIITILDDGSCSQSPKGFEIASSFTLRSIKARRVALDKLECAKLDRLDEAHENLLKAFKQRKKVD